MRGIVLGIVVLLVLALVFGGWFVGQRNTLVTMRGQAEAQWTQVENQLQRRNDLIPNIVATVKGFAQQEQSVIDSVTRARAQLGGARTREEQIQGAQEVESALARLLVVVENYPQLKSDVQFTGLRDELAGTENRIAVERMRYNELVRDYNIRIQQVPTNVVASLGGFQPLPPFTAAPGARDVPRVDFGRPAAPAAAPAGPPALPARSPGAAAPAPAPSR
jgi:LemA protein